MATHFLGPQIDIHGGGIDLMFPHRSCEIAQIECATGVHPYICYWMHLGLVKLGGAKMSKLLGSLLDNGTRIVFPKWIFSLEEPGSTIEHGVERNSIGVGFIGQGIR